MEILLPTATSITSPLSDMQMGISLNRDYNVIDEFDIKNTINLYDQYVKERNDCTLYRLILTIDPVCTNVLFNPVTIVLDKNKNRLEDKPILSGTTVIGVNDYNYVTDAVYCPSNNQTSNPNISAKKPYTYYCGYNIFDNYLFRTELFKRAIKLDDISNNLYVYIMDDIISFPSAITNSLIEYDGWVGFRNPSKIITYTQATSTSPYTKETSALSFLVNKNNCDIIDMFPTREMFSFNPIVSGESTNGFSMEYNWNYIITYPFESYYDHFLVQSDNINGIPILYVSFLSVGDTGNTFSIPVLQIQTAYNNGLNFDDTIEIETQTIKRTYKVTKIIDSYTFNVRNDNVLTLTDFNKSRLRRIVSGIRSEYYIRKFRKLPNWKFESEEITLNNIDDKLGSNNINFTNSSYGLSFASNIYDDKINQTVFTDSLDIKYLTDNLGRPLTELYLTIIKNSDKNATYQQYWGDISSGFELQDLIDNNLWFSPADLNTFISNYPSIFYLHNLQKNGGSNVVLPSLTASLPYILSVNTITVNTDTTQPILKFPVSPNSLDSNVNDIEISGDIVEFNKYTMNEIVLAPVMYRFNTATRESFDERDRVIKFHEIYQDDNDKGLDSSGHTQLTFQYDALGGRYFSNTINRDCDGTGTSSNYFIYRGLLNVGPRPEGYYYQAHNRIPLKNWSNNLNQTSFALIDFSEMNEEDYSWVRNGTSNSLKQICFITIAIHHLISEDLVRIEWDYNNKHYDKIFTVRIDLKDKYKFLILYDDTLYNGTNVQVRYFSLDVPSYSQHIGNGRYVWKNILVEGEREDINTTSLEHVFTNGHLYLDSNIKFYLKRQDPFGEHGMIYTEFPNDIYGDKINLENSIYNQVNEQC